MEAIERSKIFTDLVIDMVKDSTIGRLDTANEAVAAMGYLIYLVEGLRRQGISKPTFLDVRAAYNFGPNAGVMISRAERAALMKNIINNDHTLKINGLNPTSTVEDWQQNVISKVGYSAANSLVM